MFPAHAGMVPPGCRRRRRRCCVPRARGDGPAEHLGRVDTRGCSPRTRGWSQRRYCRGCLFAVFPAHAGMVPAARPGRSGSGGVPRARGDGPGCPARPERFWGCSPRTRGWSQGHGRVLALGRVFPAHAGMVPGTCCRTDRCAGVPRARGDGPSRTSVRMVAIRCSPRTRGWSRPTRNVNCCP